ncbi:MAG: 50S ribosomal protein L7ae [Clostridiales bacterium]|nr:50S ribosomal protein L7ae [Clostridiales bacterium]
MTEQETARIKGFLGLCHRAGQVVLGQDACLGAVRKKSAALALLDESSSEPSKKRFRNACESHRVPLYLVPEGLIDGALGKSGAMTAVVRRGAMAQKLSELLPKEAIINTQQPTNHNDHADFAGVQA